MTALPLLTLAVIAAIIAVDLWLHARRHSVARARQQLAERPRSYDVDPGDSYQGSEAQDSGHGAHWGRM